MNDYLDAYDQNLLVKKCKTCESYIGGVCACGNDKIPYGSEVDPENSCDNWDASLRYFEELEDENRKYVESLDQDELDKRCRTCQYHIGDNCFSSSVPKNIKLFISPSDTCKGWMASSEYICKLRGND